MTHWLTENWGAKLVSLILAVGLWYYAVGEENIEVTRTVPLEIKLEDEKMSIVGNPTRVVLVTLAAPRSLLANLTSETLKAEHRVKKVENPGDYSFRLEPREIRLPSEKIRVVRIEPEVIQVRVDEVIVQKFEVEPVFLGEPAFGYQLESAEVQLDPNAVLVEGPKSQLEKFSKIKTQPIDLVGRSRSFRKTVRLVQDPGVKILTEALVDAYIPIREVGGERTLEGVPVRVLGNAGSFSRISVNPDHVTLALRGSTQDLETLEVKDVLAYVEISDLSEGTHELPLRTVLPPGISVKGEPPSIKVTLQRKAVLSIG